jgi:hypothetical protein
MIFINAMYKHTKDYDNDLEEEMQRRFQNTICNAKKGKADILMIIVILNFIGHIDKT